MNDPPNNLITFAEFELDTVHRKLLRDGEVVPLHAKAFDLLTFLASNSGRIVSKEDILDAVWENQFVEESNLVVQISNLRKALGETKSSTRFLVTVPGKGYKFVADVDENTLVIETHLVSELTFEEEEIKPSLTKKAGVNWKWLSVAGFSIFTLVGIGWIWGKNSQPPSNKQLRLSKITTSGRIVNVTMSPDGNFAVFAQKEDNGESLWLRQLETGSEKRIVEPQPLSYVGLTVSPDSQFIYASKFLKNEVDPILEKMPLLGGISQTVPNIDCSSAISISPDGKRFAFTDSNSAEKETVFGIANIDGSDSHILLHGKNGVRFFPEFQSSPIAWSPTGDEIAVAVSEKNGKDSFSKILMVDPNDGAERYLIDRHWQNIDNLAWIDADRLAFIAREDDGLPAQVWVISRKSGEAKQLTNELKDYDWIAAHEGKILTIQISSTSSLRIADFNEIDRSLKIKEIFNASEYIDELDWAINGDIVYSSKASGKNELWQISKDGLNPKQLTANANVRFGIAVSPNDGSIVFASKQNSLNGIWQVDAGGKNLRQLSEGGDKSPDISNDGKVVFHRGLGYAEGIFLSSSNETKLLSEKCYYPAISPDGAKTACYFMDLTDNKWRIALLSNDSGELIGKITLPTPIYERQIRWHPSGKFITQIFSEGENLKLILFPVDGEKSQIIEGLGKGESNLPEWSRDGTQFLYSLITGTQDAVMLTDF